LNLRVQFFLKDGTSSVTFLPYIGGNFVKEYVIPYYIGESMSSFVPGVLALVQGLGQNPGCHNVTEGNATFLKPLPIVPNYSVSTYFILMCLLLCASIGAFSILNFTEFAKKQRKQYVTSENQEINAKVEPLNSTTKLNEHGDQSCDHLEIDESALNVSDDLTSNSPRKSVNIGSFKSSFDKEELVLYFITFWLTL
jgi:hypothetical protein